MKIFLLVGLVFTATLSFGQAETTQALQKRYEDSFTLYFYKNTLRMLNQSENKEFDELIKNIEKLKFLMVDKEGAKFGPAEYKKLKADYGKESYESMVTARYEGKDMDVLIRDKKGETLGTVVLVNDSTNLMVLDIIGTMDISRAGSLFTVIDQSTDVGQRIKNFTNRKNKKGKDEDKDEEKSDH